MENLNEKENVGEITQATNKVEKMKILYKRGNGRILLDQEKIAVFVKSMQYSSN